MFTVIAAILHLGNVSFELDDFDAAMVTNTNGAIKVASVGSHEKQESLPLANPIHHHYHCSHRQHR